MPKLRYVIPYRREVAVEFESTSTTYMDVIREAIQAGRDQGVLLDDDEVYYPWPSPKDGD